MPIVVSVSAMRAGGQTSVCGLSFSRSGIGTVITGRIKTLSNVGYIRVCKTISSDNEQHCNQSGIGCHRLHLNKFVALSEKLYRIQCTNGRMNDAVFKVGWIFRGNTAISTLFFWKSCTVHTSVVMKECDTVMNAMNSICVKLGNTRCFCIFIL